MFHPPLPQKDGWLYGKSSSMAPQKIAFALLRSGEKTGKVVYRMLFEIGEYKHYCLDSPGSLLIWAAAAEGFGLDVEEIKP